MWPDNFWPEYGPAVTTPIGGTSIMDESEIVVESWGRPAKPSTNWNEIIIQTSEQQSFVR